MKKPIPIFVWMVLFLFVLVPLLGAQDVDLSFSFPLFITSIGQSTDAMILHLLCSRMGLEHQYHQMARTEMLSDELETIFFVVGGSLKGMIFAETQLEQELQRSRALLDWIRENQIQLVVLHIGGSSRRGEITDALLDLVVPEAHFLLVQKSGDEDGYFSSAAKTYDVPLVHVTDHGELEGIIRAMFNVINDKE